jgi:hypothetical protein
MTYMSKPPTREELEAQLQAERARNDKLAADLAAANEAASRPYRGPSLSEAVYGNYANLEEWKAAGMARGYGLPIQRGNGWQFPAPGSYGGVLGEWDGSRGYFTERKRL